MVLLILAGVTIATLTGDNGLITKANEAKTKTEQAQEEELRRLTQLEAITHMEEYEYLDVSGKKVTIPAHCAVSQVEGENTLADGLVIIDINGNEWVWIEVPKTVEVYKTAGLNITSFTDDEYTKIYEDLASYAGTYRDEDNKGVATGTDEWYDGCGLEPTEYDQLKKKMLKSVYENEGFYIGKYEVGIGEENTYRTDEANPITEIPVIQANKVVYNWVTTAQAQELSERLENGLNLGNKEISLMFGIQWDLVLKYIETQGEYTKDGTNTLIDQTLIKSDSTKWGNYENATFTVTNTNAKYSEGGGAEYKPVPAEGYPKLSSEILLTTGATERNSGAGIYDLAGNVYEWTLEKSTDSDLPCSGRGGSYNYYGSNGPASNRYNNTPSNSDNSIGFRSALY